MKTHAEIVERETQIHTYAYAMRAVMKDLEKETVCTVSRREQDGGGESVVKEREIRLVLLAVDTKREAFLLSEHLYVLCSSCRTDGRYVRCRNQGFDHFLFVINQFIRKSFALLAHTYMYMILDYVHSETMDSTMSTNTRVL